MPEKKGREWYEILRNHVKEKPEKNVIRIYLRPSLREDGL